MHHTPQPATAPLPEAAHDAASQEHVMDLLHEHVPLTLLADLAELSCEHDAGSQAILRAEGAPDGAWWEPEPR